MDVAALLLDVRHDLTTNPTEHHKRAWLAPIGAEGLLAMAMRSAGFEEELGVIHSATIGPPDVPLFEFYSFGLDEPQPESIENRADYVEACLRILGLQRVEDLDAGGAAKPV